MNQNQPAAPFPIEFGITAGLVLGLSGQFPAAIVAIIAWFVLRRIRSTTPSEVLLVTAIEIAEALPTIFGILTGYVSFTSGYASFTFAVEILAVLAISLLLFFSHARLWAYLLLAHAGFVIVMRSLDFYHGAVEQRFQKIVMGSIAVRIITSWLLISFIRRPLLVHAQPSGAVTEEHENA